MSGGVDSSVAAAELLAAGHAVVGATMKLWGGPSDSGCCSVADVEDARAVADRLGIAHHVFNFTEDFDRQVVAPYVVDHAAGRTPNPCVACNRHLKFDRFLQRADQLGFDAVATGHHARVGRRPDGRWSLRRGADPAKDQSYVLHMLGQDELARLLLPVGELGKAEVRRRAAAAGLRTAGKPDSQDVCFVPRAGGRREFLSGRIPLHPAVLVDRTGTAVGTTDAVELVTVGQRRGLNHPGGAAAGSRRYAISVDVEGGVVVVGGPEDLQVDRLDVSDACWVVGAPCPDERLEVQTSAHGRPVPGRWAPPGAVALEEPIRRVAAGQSVVLYRGDEVVGGGTAAAGLPPAPGTVAPPR